MSDKILVIEDNEMVCENLCEILSLAAYDVQSASNGKEGIKKALEFLPDLIICDIMMPELDGYGVLKILNQNPKLFHIPLIYLTAKSEKADIRRGMGLGAEDYITKPFDDGDLLDAIKIRLEKAKRIQQSPQHTMNTLDFMYSEARAQATLEALSEDKEIRTYQNKDFVFQEGQIPRYLFYIINGSVKVYHTNDMGKELITEICSEGDFFGHQALLIDQHYNSSAATLCDTKIRLIPKTDFASLLYLDRDITALFVNMLSKHSENVEKTLIDMAYGSVRQKVASAIIKLSTKDKSDDYILQISRENLATLAGTAKETLIRTLSDFKSEGIIDTRGKDIIISDTGRLRQLLS